MIEYSSNLFTALRYGHVEKGILIKFPNGEHEHITNSDVESESLSMTESICSHSPIRFGTCEKAVLQFITRGVGDITGCEIEVELHINADGFYSTNDSALTGGEIFNRYFKIPYGRYVVESCEKDESRWERRKIIAYRTAEIGKNMQWDRLQIQKMWMACDGKSAMKIDIMQAMYAATGYGNVTKADGSLFFEEKYREYHIMSGFRGTTEQCQIYMDIEWDICNNFNGSRSFQIEYDNKFQNEEALLNDMVERIYDNGNLQKYAYDLTQSYTRDEIRKYINKCFGNEKLCNIRIKFLQRDYESGENVYPAEEYRSGDILYTGQIWEDDYYDEDYMNDYFSESGYGMWFAKAYRIRYLSVNDTVEDIGPWIPIKENIKKYLLKSDMFGHCFKTFEREWSSKGTSCVKNIPDFGTYYKEYMEMLGFNFKNSRDGNAEEIDISSLEWCMYLKLKDIMQICIEKERKYTVTFKQNDGNTIRSTQTGNKEYRIDQNIALVNEFEAQETEDKQKLVDSFAERINSMKYIPFRMRGIGFPHLEAGDKIRLQVEGGKTVDLIIMRRTISGIQHLVDTMEAI